jgi:hypothetical protein
MTDVRAQQCSAKSTRDTERHWTAQLVAHSVMDETVARAAEDRMLSLRLADEPGVAANVYAQRLPVVDTGQHVFLEELTIIRCPSGHDESAIGENYVRYSSRHRRVASVRTKLIEQAPAFSMPMMPHACYQDCNRPITVAVSPFFASSRAKSSQLAPIRRKSDQSIVDSP